MNFGFWKFWSVFFRISDFTTDFGLQLPSCLLPSSRLNSTFLGKNIKNLYYIIAYETEGFQIKVPMGKIKYNFLESHLSNL